MHFLKQFIFFFRPGKPKANAEVWGRISCLFVCLFAFMSNSMHPKSLSPVFICFSFREKLVRLWLLVFTLA